MPVQRVEGRIVGRRVGAPRQLRLFSRPFLSVDAAFRSATNADSLVDVAKLGILEPHTVVHRRVPNPALVYPFSILEEPVEERQSLLV